MSYWQSKQSRLKKILLIDHKKVQKEIVLSLKSIKKQKRQKKRRRKIRKNKMMKNLHSWIVYKNTVIHKQETSISKTWKLKISYLTRKLVAKLKKFMINNW